MSYHARIMNIPANGKEMDSTAYRMGHRDARHAAAEIASEAEARVTELEHAEVTLGDMLNRQIDKTKEERARVAKLESDNAKLRGNPSGGASGIVGRAFHEGAMRTMEARVRELESHPRMALTARDLEWAAGAGYDIPRKLRFEAALAAEKGGGHG